MKNKLKKPIFIGLLALLGMFLIVFFNFETVSPTDQFARDIFGLPIGQGFLFFFSPHGIVGTAMAVGVFYAVKLFRNKVAI
jgi:hypothetical protein